jgi:hypothetical protein
MNNPTVVIASVPWTDSDFPIMAPAVLKSVLTAQGITAATVDLNAEVRHRIANHPNKDSILKFFLTEQVDRLAKSDVLDTIDFMARRLLANHPEWVALSLLSYLSQIPCRWLCMRIRQLSPSTKIVIGGPGAAVSLKSLDEYAPVLKRQGLIDHYIAGDSEQSFPRLLLGQTDYPGVDSANWQQLADLNLLPRPDFDDYDWSLYPIKAISIVGSKGCVRECTFCDIHEHWSKYQWRTGANIFAEMQYQRERHGINFFTFADSLVNGNQKEYRQLITLLAEYNALQTRAEDRIRWTGAFIIRPQDQMKEADWALTAASGAEMLSVGVESFVEHIRYHIKKKFSNQDLAFALDMGKRHNVKMILLMIVGYVTETQQDFEQQLQWVRDNKHYADNPVHMVQIGSGLGILPGTWLDRNQQMLGLTVPDTEVSQDWSCDSIGSTPMLRLKWHHLMQEELANNGFTADYMQDNHVLIESYINDKYNS